MKKGTVAAVFAILSIIQLLRPGYAAVNCGQVDSALMQCVTYLTGRGGNNPSQACCAGVRTVKGLVRTTADKRAACNCVKAAANRYTNLNDRAAQSLPGKCGVQLDIPVSRNVDCNKLN